MRPEGGALICTVILCHLCSYYMPSLPSIQRFSFQIFFFSIYCIFEKKTSVSRVRQALICTFAVQAILVGFRSASSIDFDMSITKNTCLIYKTNKTTRKHLSSFIWLAQRQSNQTLRLIYICMMSQTILRQDLRNDVYI